jgi:hypothetical protein
MSQIQMTNIALDSQYKLEDVDWCDFLPEALDKRVIYKYYCPICLRYFNLMLLSKCCQNYICHLCVNDLQEQERKDSKFTAVCPFGCQHGTEAETKGSKLELGDVDPGTKIKKYSDSQKMSVMSVHTFQRRPEEGKEEDSHDLSAAEEQIQDLAPKSRAENAPISRGAESPSKDPRG